MTLSLSRLTDHGDIGMDLGRADEDGEEVLNGGVTFEERPGSPFTVDGGLSIKVCMLIYCAHPHNTVTSACKADKPLMKLLEQHF